MLDVQLIGHNHELQCMKSEIEEKNRLQIRSGTSMNVVQTSSYLYPRLVSQKLFRKQKTISKVVGAE